MSQILFNIIYSACVISLIGISFQIKYCAQKIFYISHAASITLAAYLAYLFYVQCGFSLVLSFIFAVLLVGIIELQFELFLYQKLKRNGVELWGILIASLGIYIIIQNSVSIIWGDNVRVVRTGPVMQGEELFGFYYTATQAIVILTCLILIMVAWAFLEKSVWGKMIIAFSENAYMSQLLGISKKLVINLSFFVGTLLAACSGFLISLDSGIIPTMGFDWLLQGIVAMIIGGFGRIRNLLIGSLFLCSSQHFAAYYFDPKWMAATTYIFLILFLLFRPYGFGNRKIKKASI